jgi:gliding motility-associated-like protein/uncharacterized repeat protein (TIGR01451 family)
MGGGGGGGDANQALNGVKGGVGGGIVLINVGRITGSGTVLANGSDGAPGAQGIQPDGAGGGGAGGTVYIKVTNPDPTAVLTIEAKGGKGGNTVGDIGFNEHGPGGGGGGGNIFYAMSPGMVNTNVSQGLGGKANSGAGTNNGSADGTAGKSVAFLSSSLPLYLQGGGSSCYPQLSTILYEANPTTIKYPGSAVVYTITSTNFASGGNAGGVQIEALLPTGISFKSATVTYSGDSGGPIVIINLGTPSRPIFGNFNISPGDNVTITLNAEVDCGTPPGTYSASAQSLYLDPTRTFIDPNRRITSALAAFPGSKFNYETGSPVPGSNYDGSSTANDNVQVKTAAPLGSNMISIAGNPVRFCIAAIGDLSDPSLISGSVPTGDIEIYTYQWQSSIDNVNFVNITAATTKDYDPQPITVTTYYRRVVTSSSCVAPLISNVIKITIGLNPIADFEIPDFCLNDGTAIFKNTSTIGDGSGNLTYKWNFGEVSSGSLNSSTSTDGAHIYSATGDFIITLITTSNDGCSVTRSYPFTVNGSIKKADFAVVNPTKLCSGIPVEFNDLAEVFAGQITKIEWYYDLVHNSTGVEIDDNPGLRSSPKTYSHQYPVFGTPAFKPFVVKMKVYSGATCVAELSKTIKVFATPEIEFDSIPPVCVNGSSFQITQAKEKFNIPGKGTYSGKGITATGMFNPSKAGLGKHTITYVFQADSGDCKDSKVQEILVQANPKARNDQVEILEGEGITFPDIADQSGLSYSWSPAEGLSNTTILNPVASPVKTTTYTLTVTNILTGCTEIGKIKVTVHKIPIIPNAFTPNGDGINDVWLIENLGTYTTCSVRIFNRYGEEVFTSVGYQTPWNGIFKGVPLPTGTYYYMIDPKKGRKVVSGSITILR